MLSLSTIITAEAPAMAALYALSTKRQNPRLRIATQEEFVTIGLKSQSTYEKLNGKTFKVVPNGYFSADITSHATHYVGQPLYTIIEEGEDFFFSLPECMLKES